MPRPTQETLRRIAHFGAEVAAPVATALAAKQVAKGQREKAIALGAASAVLIFARRKLGEGIHQNELSTRLHERSTESFYEGRECQTRIDEELVMEMPHEKPIYVVKRRRNSLEFHTVGKLMNSIGAENFSTLMSLLDHLVYKNPSKFNSDDAEKLRRAVVAVEYFPGVARDKQLGNPNGLWLHSIHQSSRDANDYFGGKPHLLPQER